MDIKGYKRVLEEENKKGNSIESKRVEQAKKKLLEEHGDEEEVSQVLFTLENHTIEYSIQMLDEYLQKKEIPEENKTEKNKIIYVKVIFIVAICVAALISLFKVIFSKIG